MSVTSEKSKAPSRRPSIVQEGKKVSQKLSSKDDSSSIMDNSVMRGIFASSRAAPSEPFTHTSFDPTGRYNIKKESRKTFITQLCNLVAKGKRGTLTEKPLSMAHLRVDVDFRQGNTKERIYTKDDVIKLANIYQKEIGKILSKELTKEEKEKVKTVLVLEKSKPTMKPPLSSKESEYGDGFHLDFPFFVCEPWIADDYLYKKATDESISENLWADKRITSQKNKIIDKVAKKTWLMYGNSKSLQKEPYLFSYAIGPDGEEIECRRKSLTSAKERKDYILGKVFKDEMSDKTCSPSYYLPRFLAIQKYDDEQLKLTPLNERMEEERLKFTAPKKKKSHVNVRSKDEIAKDARFIEDKKLMEMMSDDRADDYDLWMDMGWTLYCIFEGDDKGLEYWIEFSKRSSKFKEGECEEKWENMEAKGKSLGSLIAMAKHDSPEAFAEMRQRDVDYLINISCSATKANETDVGNVIYCMYKDRFKCVSNTGNGVWYEFKNHRWIPSDGGIGILKLIISEVASKYSLFMSNLAKQCSKLAEQNGGDDDDEEQRHNDNESDKLHIKMKKCLGIIDALKTTSFQSKCLQYLKILCYDSLFESIKDTNPDIFCCENGVLDLASGIFREGRPEDCCTLSCKLEYKEDYTYEHEDVDCILSKQRQIYPNKNIFNYFLSSVALCMRAGNMLKKFYMWIGPGGNNAKTTNGNLLEGTFGDYFGIIPRELFINKSNAQSGGPRADLKDLSGTRIAMGSEVTKQDTFNIGVLKQMTSNDSQWIRGMYEKRGIKTRPTWTVIIQCNNPPKIPGDDPASWNRIRLVDHESVFDADAPEDEEEQVAQKHFPGDSKFVNEIKNYSQAFLWILFQEYKRIKKLNFKIEEPQEVTMSTNKYRANNDIYKQFILDKFEIVNQDEKSESDEEESEDEKEDKKSKSKKKKSKETEAFLKISDAYSEFKVWRDEEYPGLREKVGKGQFEKEITSRLPKGTLSDDRKKWKGYRLVREEIDEEASNEISQLLSKKKKLSKCE